VEETYVLFSYTGHKYFAIHQEGSEASGHGENGGMNKRR